MPNAERSAQPFRRIQFPNAIAPEIRVEEIEEVRKEAPSGHAVESEQEQDEKRNHDRAIRQSEPICVEEIAGAEEEVIPKRVDEQDRTDQSESGVSPRRRWHQKET